MQLPRTQPKPPVGVIFDCAPGNGIDDLLALALLYGFDTKNEARVVSLSVSEPNLNAARLCDAVARFYVSMAWGQFAAFARSLPIGLIEEGAKVADTPVIAGVLAKSDSAGKPVYHHSIQTLNDTGEVAAQLRNALTAQHDGNALIVLTGPSTNLAKLLDVRGARELIAAKVRLLSMLAGSYDGGEAQSNIKADVAAAKRLFAEWPTPIVAAGPEIGAQLLFPASSIENDYVWAPSHPVVDAYRAYKPMPHDAPTMAMTPVLYAIRPQESYFKLSEPGRISVSDDGRTQFSGSADGTHRHLIFDPAQKDRIIKAYTEVACLKPVQRRPRFLQQQEEEKDKEKKPDAPKPAGSGF